MSLRVTNEHNNLPYIENQQLGEGEIWKLGGLKRRDQKLPTNEQ